MPSSPTASRLCLVTGASSGIGAAFAREYASWGYDLCLTARREARLEAMAEELRTRHGAKVIVAPADLAEPGAVDRILARVRDEGRHVDALVNNAGYGLTGAYAETPWDRQQAFLQVMVTTMAELSHKLLPGMVERRFGRMVNVASVAGFLPGSAGYTLYSAAKAFVLKMSEALHVEAAGSGVHVTAVCPGLTRSEFFEASDNREMAARAPGFVWMTAEAVAKAGHQACEANRPVLTPGALNAATVALLQLVPESAGLSVAARLAPFLRKG